MPLDGSIEQLVENGFLIQDSVGVSQLSDGSGISLKRRLAHYDIKSHHGTLNGLAAKQVLRAAKGLSLCGHAKP